MYVTMPSNAQTELFAFFPGALAAYALLMMKLKKHRHTWGERVETFAMRLSRNTIVKLISGERCLFALSAIAWSVLEGTLLGASLPSCSHA